MHFLSQIKGLVLALAIAPLSLAVPQGWQQGNNAGIDRDSPVPTTKCYTDAVTKQTRKPSTKWATRTTSCTRTSTLTLTVTTTPVTTSTVTKTSTKTSTAPATTDTATSTSTTTTTTTTISTSTSTSTSTTTTTTSTFTVVPTSAEFIPIETSVPGSTTQRTPTKNKKRASGFDPNIEFSRSKQAYSPANRVGSSASGANFIPGGDVNCYVNVGKCATATVKRTITIAAPKSTTTTTTISTKTVTATPGCTTNTTITTTSTSTSTSTTTTTTTTTSTETATSFTSTSYAACATSNLEYYVNNVPVSGGNPSTSLTLVLPNDASNNSPYDCCVSLILDPIGAIAGFTFNDFNNGLNGQCYIFEDRIGQCAAGQASGLISPVRINPNLQVPTAANANGYCGVWSPPDGT